VCRIVASDAAAVELSAAGEADATGTNVNAAVVPEIVRTDQLRLLVWPSAGFYHVGYNVRRAPLSNPRFRRVLARLLDKESIVRDAFHGYATPAASPLATTEWLASDLEWVDRDPVLPFLGTNARLNVDRARTEFERAGYRYSENGRLIER
jgi:peptide/nickel transport system substrate-binding protein